MSFSPTSEQQDIRDAFKSGGDVAVTALAGTGKTSTLQLLAQDAPRTRMVYVAFNKAIANEAQGKFGRNVVAKTMHSFAYRAVGARYRDRLEAPRVPAREVANFLRLSPITLGEVNVSDFSAARLVMEGITRFCHSADDTPNVRHLPPTPGLNSAQQSSLNDYLAPALTSAWEDLIATRGKLRFTHDVYLKIWSMQYPMLPGDVILADEWQDADPVIKSIVDAQDARKVYVGDSNQQIYAWRGAIDALARVKVAHRLPLQKSFRFGPAIADEANLILEQLGSPLRVQGHEPVQSILGLLNQPQCLLTRTNGTAIGELMRAQINGTPTALVGGTKQVESLVEAALALIEGRPTQHPELMAFSTWTELRDYAENDSDGREFRTLVRLMERHGPTELLTAIKRTVPESRAALVISTAHKSKGREWDRVQLADDFMPIDEETGELRPDEARLIYVAVTRAKKVLDSLSLSDWLGEREFVPANELPCFAPAVPADPQLRLEPSTYQVVPDPNDQRRVIIRQTGYDPELVQAMRGIQGRKFYRDYLGEANINQFPRGPEVLALAEQFCLTVDPTLVSVQTNKLPADLVHEMDLLRQRG